MITRYKIFKENLLKPTTSIDDKLLKVQATNKQLLMDNEVLDIDDIDESWDFELDSNLIKTKKIEGYIILELNHIPEWLKDIEIDGSFNCTDCNLINLNNCPKIINGSFNCSHNKLTTLEEGPTFVGKNYYSNYNSVQFTEEYIRSICKVDGEILV